MTKQEIADWRHHPITQEFFIEINRRIDGLKDEIVGQLHDSDIRELSVKAGAIRAFRDILDLDFIEESHGD